VVANCLNASAIFGMTLLALSYQRAQAGPDGNSPEMLDAHFEYIAATFTNVLPGEPVPAGRTAACIGFDGAFYDFYQRVFPLLTKHKLRAVLAVAPAVIRDHSNRSMPRASAGPTRTATAEAGGRTFCSWGELQEVARSGLVAIAAHGYTHRALDDAGNDVETEVHVPRTLLSARLRVPVDSFVFPFGRYCRSALREARSGYQHVFIDKPAFNRGWGKGIVFRVACDNLQSPTAPFEGPRLLGYRTRGLWHRLLMRS
jgi:peptidoglycan/xylan/chitin deacetylase (PgdA/CDA1 family)